MIRSIPFVSALALLAGMGTAHADITIGLGGPTSGSVAALGEQVIIGAQQAIKDINAKGGVLGQQLVLKIGDDACDPRQAVAVANRFVTEKVVAVEGHVCSGSTMPAAEIYNEEGMVMISPTATSPALTERGFKSVFRACGRDDQQGIVSGRYLAEKYKDKAIAVVDDKQSYGKGLADVVASTLEKAGVKVAYRGSITAGEKDFSALMINLKQRNVDVVYYGGYHPELGLMVRQARELGLQARFIAGDGLNNPEFWSITGAVGEGTLYTDSPSAASDPAARQLVETFKAAGRTDPTNFVFYSYAVIQTIAQAIEKAGSTDSKKITAALHDGTFNTVVGQLQFDKKGDVVKPAYVLYEWKDGKTRVVGQ